MTTLSVNALAAAGELEHLDRKDELRDWLLKQQYKERHPYTGADPGGWAWTDLPGGVPDADDTPGAILALSQLMNPEETSFEANKREGQCMAGVRWLLGLQNSDGGWPTFCRGWGHLPFDRSGCDLSAHALRVIACWLKRFWYYDYQPNVIVEIRQCMVMRDIRYWCRVIDAGFAYLARTQRSDGAGSLVFGNQHMPNDENPTTHRGAGRVSRSRYDGYGARGIAWL